MITRSTYDVLEAFRAVRRLSDKLWVASSETEMLELVREHGLAHFASDVVMTDVRAGFGTWIELSSIGDRETCERLELFRAFSAASFSPALLDELHYVTVLREAGDVMTRADSPPPSGDFAEHFERALEVVDWQDVNFMAARLRSSCDFVAGVAVIDKKRRRDFTVVDRAGLSAVAQLASHALSGLVQS